jgi:glutathione S-transferase
MFAPVITRFITYGVKLSNLSLEYARAVIAIPAMREWCNYNDTVLEM